MAKPKTNKPRKISFQGIELVPQKKLAKSTDPKDPFYGNISIRGKNFTGTVANAKMQKTATVIWERIQYVPKYERYEKRRTKIHAHNPDSIDAKEGDKVLVMETKPLSKTKNFVIVKILGKDIDYEIKEQSIKADEEVMLEKKAKLDKKKEERHKEEEVKLEDVDVQKSEEIDSDDFGEQPEKKEAE